MGPPFLPQGTQVLSCTVAGSIWAQAPGQRRGRSGHQQSGRSPGRTVVLCTRLPGGGYWSMVVRAAATARAMTSSSHTGMGVAATM